ncbi:MAG: IS110 family transposase, partial [Gammaproteobacteria bacterium]
MKPDRRDAVPLARRMRVGDLPPGSVPQAAEDAMRARGRAREEAIGELKTATLRLQACVRRPALRSTGRATWGPAHLRGLAAVGCPTPAQPSVLPASGRALTAQTAPLARLAPALKDQAPSWRLRPVVEALQARRGGPCLGAVTPVADRGDL